MKSEKRKQAKKRHQHMLTFKIYYPGHSTRNTLHEKITKSNLQQIKCWRMELRKKKSIIKEFQNLNLAIKKIRIKIKIKNKLEGNFKFFIVGWNWKEK